MYMFWDGKPITTPLGSELNVEEIYTHFPFASRGKVIIEIVGGVTYNFSPLGVLLHNYNIDENLSDEDKLAAIVEAVERERNPPPDGDVDAMLDYLEGRVNDDALDA